MTELQDSCVQKGPGNRAGWRVAALHDGGRRVGADAAATATATTTETSTTGTTTATGTRGSQ